MKVFPFNQPMVLTDSIFLSYGGITGSSTDNMRKIAYQIAEQQMSSHIGTLLLQTNITGTWDYSPSGYIATDYGYVESLLWVNVLDRNGTVVKTLNDTRNFASVHEDTYGYIYVHSCLSVCGLASNYPYKFQAVYQAGLPSGVTYQPGILMALTMAAQLTLNELFEVSANEGVGDVGIERYTSLGYSEVRKKWKNSSFGASAKSAKIAQLVDSTIKKCRRAVMLGKM